MSGAFLSVPRRFRAVEESRGIALLSKTRRDLGLGLSLEPAAEVEASGVSVDTAEKRGAKKGANGVEKLFRDVNVAGVVARNPIATSRGLKTAATQKDIPDRVLPAGEITTVTHTPSKTKPRPSRCG